MISLCGLGWIDGKHYGHAKKRARVPYDGGGCGFRPRIKEILPHPFNNFGRLDPASKSACYAVALALQDSGIAYPPDGKEDFGIIGTGAMGCMDSDIRYFKDYLDCGRTSGRSNLFVYTLPTSPISEAAIHFGLQGPLFYVGSSGNILANCVSQAVDVIKKRDASIMLAGESKDDGALFMAFADASAYEGDLLCDSDEAMAILEKRLDFSDTAKEFENIFRP